MSIQDGRCDGITKSGERCKKRVLPGKDMCMFHEPTLETQRLLWRKQGGYASGLTRQMDKARRERAPDLIERLELLEHYLRGKGFRI